MKPYLRITAAMALLAVVGFAVIVKADSTPTQAELNARIEALQMELQAVKEAAARQVQQAQSDADAAVNRMTTARDNALALVKQLEQSLKDSVDRYLADRAAWLKERDRFLTGLPAAQPPKPEEGKVVAPPRGAVMAPLPVVPGAAVRPGDIVDIKGEFPATDGSVKSRELMVLAGATVAGVLTTESPGAESKIEIIHVFLSTEEALNLQQIAKRVVGGRFTITAPPALARLTPEALALAGKDLPAPPQPKEKPKAGGLMVPPALPPITGRVTAVDNEAKVAMIDLGSSNGVVKGMKLVVYEGTARKYLATLIITAVSENNAAGDLSVIREAIKVGSAVTNQFTE